MSAHKGSRWRVNWVAFSAVIATLSLVAALVFSAIQLRDAAVSQRQTKIATELGLLTQLQTVISRSAYSRVPYEQQFRELRAGRRSVLTADAYRATAEEAANMDYFAWLFNNRYVTARGAEELWGPRMICEYKRAFAPAFQEAARDLTNLFEFVRARDRALSHLSTCPE
jgi:hypothetical protein